jgi:hypothetical protein
MEVLLACFFFVTLYIHFLKYFLEKGLFLLKIRFDWNLHQEKLIMKILPPFMVVLYSNIFIFSKINFDKSRFASILYQILSK